MMTCDLHLLGVVTGETIRTLGFLVPRDPLLLLAALPRADRWVGFRARQLLTSGSGPVFSFLHSASACWKELAASLSSYSPSSNEPPFESCKLRRINQLFINISYLYSAWYLRSIQIKKKLFLNRTKTVNMIIIMDYNDNSVVINLSKKSSHSTEYAMLTTFSQCNLDHISQNYSVKILNSTIDWVCLRIPK